MIKEMIRLTKAQADSVRGRYGAHELRPRKIGGHYYLPTGVLDNTNYTKAFPILEQCGIEPVNIDRETEEEL